MITGVDDGSGISADLVLDRINGQIRHSDWSLFRFVKITIDRFTFVSRTESQEFMFEHSNCRFPVQSIQVSGYSPGVLVRSDCISNWSTMQYFSFSNSLQYTFKINQAHRWYSFKSEPRPSLWLAIVVAPWCKLDTKQVQVRISMIRVDLQMNESPD
jgi:hypothetical protein